MRRFERMNSKAYMPTRSTKGSAGYDFYIPDSGDIVLEPWESQLIKTGIRAEMPEDEVLLLFIRSGLGNKGLELMNKVGVIDSDYYGNPDTGGEIMAKLRNTTDQTMHLAAGDRFMQGIFVEYKTVDDDDTTAERTGGFGSTGR